MMNQDQSDEYRKAMYDMYVRDNQQSTENNDSGLPIDNNDLELQRQRAIAMAEAKAKAEEEALAGDQKLITPGATDTSTGRTMLDKTLQGTTFALSDEPMDALGAGLGYLGLKAKNLFDEDKPYSKVTYEDLLKQAREESKARLDLQSEERPWLSLGSELGGAVAGGVAMTVPKAFGAARVAPAATSISRGAINEIPKIGASVLDWTSRGNKLQQAGKLAATSIPSAALYGFGEGQGIDRFENALEQAPYGLIPSAIPLARGAYGVGKTVAKSAKDFLSPEIERQTADLAKIAMDKYNIPLRKTQITDSRLGQGFASVAEKAPLSGGDVSYREQQKAFNKAIANTFGVEADNVSAATIKKGYEKTGELFDSALEGLSVKLDDPKIIDTLAKIQSETQYLSNDQAKIVNKQIDKFIEQANDQGWVPAEKLGSFRSDLTKTLSRTTGDAKNYLKDLRDVVADVSVAGNKERAEMLTEARKKYKNLKTIEDIASKSPDGNISPALLLTPTKKSFSGTFSRGGDSDLEELARIGKRFLQDKIPNSGTPERLQAMALLNAPAMLLASPAGLPTALAMGAISSGGAAAFNAANRNQKTVKALVEKAIKKSEKSKLPPAAKKSPLSYLTEKWDKDLPKVNLPKTGVYDE